MKNLLLACLLISLTWFTHAAEKRGPVALFDGQTFSGWEGDLAKTWRIKDGALVGGNLNEKVPRNEFLCTTRRYTNFVLHVKFKLLGGEKANAGIQIRTERIPNHHEVSGYQADMGDPKWRGAERSVKRFESRYLDCHLNQDYGNSSIVMSLYHASLGGPPWICTAMMP